MDPSRSLLFPLHGFADWNGGVDLAKVLSTAIRHPDVEHAYDVHYAFPQPSVPQRLFTAGLRYWRLRRARGAGTSPAGSPAALRAAARDIAREHEVIVCAANGRGIAAAASQVQADIVFPTMLPLGSTRIPRVGYLFDFQHRRMPELFSARTRRNRDKRFARLAADANAVVVYAKATARDAVEFLDIAPERIMTLPYAPHAHPWWFEENPNDVRARYGIGAQYLLVSNHFWKHKDHSTALRAFAMLRGEARFPNIQLVLTGDPVDHRDPRHYSNLQDLCGELRIRHAVHFLGLIPKRDQLALLRGCMALLQPTLFEGGPGGGAVFEAIGLGVPAVVSDIPVNLEIDQGEVRFFRTGDPSDLAFRTAEILSAPPRRPSRDQLLDRGDANLGRLGKAIVGYLANVQGR